MGRIDAIRDLIDNFIALGPEEIDDLRVDVDIGPEESCEGAENDKGDNGSQGGGSSAEAVFRWETAIGQWETENFG